MSNNKKLVFQGKIFKIYQWKQKMLDGTYKTFEMAVREPSVHVLPIFNNKIVMADEKQVVEKTWKTGIISGRMDKIDETPLQTAKRELLEEAGMSSRKWKLIRSATFPSTTIKWTTHLFAALDCKIVGKPVLDGGERIKLRFVNFDKFLEMRNLRLWSDMQLYFRDIKENPKKKKVFRKLLGL